MAESALGAIQRQQIEIAIGEYLLTSDFYIQQSIVERIRHLISHADPTLDKSLTSCHLTELKPSVQKHPI
jgi:hypothetical protein